MNTVRKSIVIAIASLGVPLSRVGLRFSVDRWRFSLAFGAHGEVRRAHGQAPRCTTN
jgi:hypothetical protein